MDWQPIKTAPEGEWIMVYGEDSHHVALNEMTDWDGFYDKPVRAWMSDDGCWVHPDDGFKPTHWMPLPEPPK